SADRPRLRSPAAGADGAVDAAAVHRVGAAAQRGRLAPLRAPPTRAAPAVFRLDRLRQARGDETAAREGGDSPPGSRQSAGPQVTGRRACEGTLWHKLYIAKFDHASGSYAIMSHEADRERSIRHHQ